LSSDDWALTNTFPIVSEPWGSQHSEFHSHARNFFSLTRAISFSRGLPRRPFPQKRLSGMGDCPANAAAGVNLGSEKHLFRACFGPLPRPAERDQEIYDPGERGHEADDNAPQNKQMKGA